MDKQQAKQILSNRVLIPSEGKYTVKVTGTSPFMRGEQATTIVNFAAMTPWQVNKAKEKFNSGNFQEATNTNLTASQLPGQYVPAKGETVDIEVSEIENNDGVKILVVSGIVPRVAQKASAITAFDDDEEEVAIV